MTIDEYIDAAARALRTESDRAIGRALNRSGATVCAWRCRRAWPDDQAMVAMAKLAGLDPAQALLELNSWRSKSSEAQLLYSELARRLASSVMAMLFTVIATGTTTEQVSAGVPNTIHYAIFGDAARYTDLSTAAWNSGVSATSSRTQLRVQSRASS